MASENAQANKVVKDGRSIQMQREEMERYSMPSSSSNEKQALSESFNECDSSLPTVQPFSMTGVQETRFQSEKSEQVTPRPDPLNHLHSPPPSYFNEPEGSFSGSQSLESSKKEELPNLVATYGVGLPSREYLSLPLSRLSYETRRQIGLRMDPDTATVANWRSMADRLDFENLEIRNFESERFKTECVLEVHEKRNPKTTVGDLCEILQDLERHDVITDVEDYFERDFQKYKQRSSLSSTLQYEDIKRSPAPSYRTTEYDQDPSISTTVDHEVVDEFYDGFLIYDAADKEFILNEFLPNVEDKNGKKLFLPERDLTAGVQTYHQRLKAMISRCQKLIIILSDDFLKSEKSQWALNVGVSLDPASRHQKIIPVIYKSITEPNILGGYNACDRTRVLKDEWFWNNLIKSINKGRA